MGRDTDQPPRTCLCMSADDDTDDDDDHFSCFMFCNFVKKYLVYNYFRIS